MATKRAATKAKSSKQDRVDMDERVEQNLVIDSQPKEEQLLSVKLKKSYVSIIVALLFLTGVAYYFKGFVVAAMVNGQPIYRITVLQELEKQGGKQILNTLVTRALILQEAKKQNITISDKEFNDEIKKIESNVSQRGQKLDQLLKTQGMTMAELKEQVRMQKTLEKIVGKDIKITDKEVEDYLKNLKDSGVTSDKSEDAQKKEAIDQLKQQKLNEKIQSWVQEAQKKAKIINFVQY